MLKFFILVILYFTGKNSTYCLDDYELNLRHVKYLSPVESLRSCILLPDANVDQKSFSHCIKFNLDRFERRNFLHEVTPIFPNLINKHYQDHLTTFLWQI